MLFRKLVVEVGGVREAAFPLLKVSGEGWGGFLPFPIRPEGWPATPPAETLSAKQHISFSRKPLFLQSLFNSILLDLPFQAQPQRHPSALTIEMVS